jgi:hypothetical protein
MLSSTDLRTAFAEMGFSFAATTPVGGRPRVIGRPRDHFATLELIGERGAEVQATLSMLLVSPHINERNSLLATILLSFCCPGWAGRQAWLAENLPHLRAISPITLADGHRVAMYYTVELNQVLLIIKEVPRVGVAPVLDMGDRQPAGPRDLSAHRRPVGRRSKKVVKA